MYLQFSLKFLLANKSTKELLAKIHSRTEMTIANFFRSLYDRTLKFFQLLKTTSSTIHISKEKLNSEDNLVTESVVL